MCIWRNFWKTECNILQSNDVVLPFVNHTWNYNPPKLSRNAWEGSKSTQGKATGLSHERMTSNTEEFSKKRIEKGPHLSARERRHFQAKSEAFPVIATCMCLEQKFYGRKQYLWFIPTRNPNVRTATALLATQRWRHLIHGQSPWFFQGMHFSAKNGSTEGKIRIKVPQGQSSNF